MDMPDRKFPLIWTAFLFLVVTAFAVIETWALMTGGTTLSRYTFEITRAWPLATWLIGVLQGGLAVHFFWHWSPPGSESKG